MNVTICCINLKTRMRFTGEPVERSRLDLATTTFYNPAVLLRLLVVPVLYDTFARASDWLSRRMACRHQ